MDGEAQQDPRQEAIGSSVMDELIEIECALDSRGAQAILAAIGIDVVEAIDDGD